MTATALRASLPGRQSGAFRGWRCSGGVLAKRRSFGIFAGMSITAIVENDTIKLPPGLHLPDGTEVRIETKAPAGRSVAERYATLAGAAEDMPADLARNLDHYLHGHARKP